MKPSTPTDLGWQRLRWGRVEQGEEEGEDEEAIEMKSVQSKYFRNAIELPAGNGRAPPPIRDSQLPLVVPHKISATLMTAVGHALFLGPDEDREGLALLRGYTDLLQRGLAAW